MLGALEIGCINIQNMLRNRKKIEVLRYLFVRKIYLDEKNGTYFKQNCKMGSFHPYVNVCYVLFYQGQINYPIGKCQASFPLLSVFMMQSMKSLTHLNFQCVLLNDLKSKAPHDCLMTLDVFWIARRNSHSEHVCCMICCFICNSGIHKHIFE